MDASLTLLNDIVEKVQRSQTNLLAENKALKLENEMLKNRIANQEQYPRINNVEIKGVPCIQGKDCFAFVESIGQKISCPVDTDDLDIVHRVPA